MARSDQHKRHNLPAQLYAPKPREHYSHVRGLAEPTTLIWPTPMRHWSAIPPALDDAPDVVAADADDDADDADFAVVAVAGAAVVVAAAVVVVVAAVVADVVFAAAVAVVDAA